MKNLVIRCFLLAALPGVSAEGKEIIAPCAIRGPRIDAGCQRYKRNQSNGLGSHLPVYIHDGYGLNRLSGHHGEKLTVW